MSLPSSSIAAAILMGTLFGVACTESQSTSPTVPSVLSSSAVDAPSSRTSPQLGVGLNGSGTLVVDNDGADCANPDYNTIQAAVNAAEAGTTILVCAGTYNERVVIETDGLRLLAKG
jgi:pectin methylesterase-like acyl-CoA thioesterase